MDKFGWTSIYRFSTSIGLIGIIVISTLIPETEKHEKVPYDFAGAIALFIGIGCVLGLPMVQQMKPGVEADPSLLAELGARGINLNDFLQATLSKC